LKASFVDYSFLVLIILFIGGCYLLVIQKMPQLGRFNEVSTTEVSESKMGHISYTFGSGLNERVIFLGQKNLS